MKKRFTIRIYGLLLNEQRDAILLSRERINGNSYLKLPGGGMEWGEGLLECLRREIREETGLEILIHKHIFTTDVFQQSVFDEDVQVLSVYYTCSFNEAVENLQSPEPEIVFEWKKLSELKPEEMSFPIDSKVLAEWPRWIIGH